MRVQYSSHSLTHTKETQRSKTSWIDVIYPKSANESVVFASVGDVAVLKCRARGHTEVEVSWVSSSWIIILQILFTCQDDETLYSLL